MTYWTQNATYEDNIYERQRLDSALQRSDLVVDQTSIISIPLDANLADATRISRSQKQLVSNTFLMVPVGGLVQLDDSCITNVQISSALL